MTKPKQHAHSVSTVRNPPHLNGRELEHVREALLAAIKEGPQAIALFDPHDVLAYGNAAFRTAWALEHDAFPTFADIMRSCHARSEGALIATNDIEAWIKRANDLRRHGSAFRSFEVDLYDGRWFWITERRLNEGWVLAIGQDVTPLKNSERTLQVARDAAVRSSLTDPLTQLANRRRALDQLDGLLATNQDFHLALVDIDHFKGFNDRFGHAAGDEVLVRVAWALQRLEDVNCSAARLAGDEFAVIGPLQRDRFEAVLRGLAEELAAPFELEGHFTKIELSIGVACSSLDGVTSGELLASADAAMYEAKRNGRSTLRFFERWMSDARHAHAELCRDLPGAIARGEVVPFYQPIVDLSTGLVRGLEALVRWRHPVRGVLSPAAFASVFTDPGLATAIDDLMLRTALADLEGWINQGLPVTAVNVNASDAQLHRPDLVGRVEALLHKHRLRAECLKIEVVETAFLGRDPAHVAATITALKDLGVVCVLDDFGTGFASLSHLRQFDIGRIKIDRSFTANICSDPFDRSLVKGIVELGRSIGMRITAEGVETQEQVRLLQQFGCACAQGYWIGRPTAASDVPNMIARWYARYASLAERPAA